VLSLPTSWNLRGSYFEACNCDAICPCRTVGDRAGGRSTFGICQFALSWHITEGRADDVILGDLSVVLAGWYDDDEPGSPWRISLYIDDTADDAQYGSLTSIFLGRAGGTALENFAASHRHCARGPSGSNSLVACSRTMVHQGGHVRERVGDNPGGRARAGRMWHPWIGSTGSGSSRRRVAGE